MTMTNNETKKVLAELRNTNRLYRRVISEIVQDSKEYSGKNLHERISARCSDVAHGLSSGIVGSLIYYTDTTKFFKLYRPLILEMLQDLCNDTGMTPQQLLKGFDAEDYFIRDTQNRNLLAWFAYEEINNQLLNALEC